MKVNLLTNISTTDIVNIIYSACRQCYSREFVGDVDLSSVSNNDKITLIRDVLKSGHHSTLEHISLTFAVSGISRACAQQLTRHRMASYSMQSQRYCDMNDLESVMPESIRNNLEMFAKYRQFIKFATMTYSDMIASGISKEDARAILPMSSACNIVFTMNLRSLIHFLEERLCNRAQKEIRNLAGSILNLCIARLPFIFDSVGSKCRRLGFCMEPEKRSCGLMKTRGK